jgi:hypothetical protein
MIRFLRALLRLSANGKLEELENDMPDDLVAPKAEQSATTPGDGSDPTMAAMGELICRLNPYTRLPQNEDSGLSTGDMEVGMLSPAGTGYAPGDPDATIACMGIEVERNYKPTWSFKGQDQSVTTAVRIPYRFAVKKNGKLIYWQTEYLLIGYVGGGGMG